MTEKPIMMSSYEKVRKACISKGMKEEIGGGHDGGQINNDEWGRKEMTANRQVSSNALKD